ncbi:hypothetical protein [Paracoccus mutanolyticus]|uniref:hypothetical protein n=1 Tax=Paracoccus mutanolyticus TaxID=1499308 RepID=UPI001CB928B6|nr:hypothetical protein [Paracoccus mutanolyticus]
MDKRLSIVIIEPDPDRAEPIMAGLRDAGDHDIRIIAGETGLARRIAELRRTAPGRIMPLPSAGHANHHLKGRSFEGTFISSMTNRQYVRRTAASVQVV